MNIHHLLSEAESAAELTLHGRIIGLTAIYDLPHLVKLDLHIASANELDLFLTFMPVNRTIQKLSIRINHNLSNAAVNGFEQLVNLKDVTLISNGSSLNRIFRCIPFKLITSLEIQHESYEPLDLNGLSDHMPRLQSLRLFAQTVKTLSDINNMVHLETLQLDIKQCVDAQSRNISNVEVNALLSLLATRNTLVTLDIGLSPEFRVERNALVEMINMDSLNKLTFCGGIHNLLPLLAAGLFTKCMQITFIEVLDNNARAFNCNLWNDSS